MASRLTKGLTMTVKAGVTLRLGVEGDERIQAALRKIGQIGDDAMASLSKEAKDAARAFDRLEMSVDASARSAAQVARTYVSANAAVAAGVRTHEDAQRVIDLAAERHRRLTGAVTDNTKAAGLARHEWINLSRQFQDVGVSLAGGQSPTLILMQQGSQIADIFSSSGAGAGAALRSFGAGAVRALASPIGIAAALAAAVFGVKAAGDAAARPRSPSSARRRVRRA
jgi:phage-related minor tail protein